MFKQEANKYDTNHYQDFFPAIIDDILYDAALDYVDLFYTGKNYRGYNLGFETTQQRIDMLSTLVKDTSLNREELNLFSKFHESVFSFENDYYHNSTLIAFDSCNNPINIEIIEHQDFLASLNIKEQRLWNLAYALVENNNIKVYYHEPINTVNQTYIKKPNRPFIGGYDTLEFQNGDASAPSQLSAPSSLDIPDTYCRVLIAIAVQNVFNNLRDYNFGSVKEKEIITNNF